MSDLLFSYESIGPWQRHARRVLADGRYELYIAGPGETPEWKSLPPYDEQQIAALRDEVLRAIATSDQDTYRADPPGPDSARATFRLAGPGGIREIVVEGWPDLAPPQLLRLLERANELRPRPESRSVWRLWSGGTVVEKRVDCAISDVPILGPLRDALFMTASGGDPGGAARGGEDPPADVPLVDATFIGPSGSERLQVFADGRREERSVSGERTEGELKPAELAAVRAALERTDWTALPEQLC